MALRRILHHLLLCCTMMLLLAGCGHHHQSILHPAGPAAAKIAWIWWVMFGVLTIYFILVMVLMLVAIFGRRREAAQPPLGSMKFIIGGGVVGPAIVLVVFLFLSLDATVAIRMPREGVRIQVTGHLWWWDVQYPDHDIITANEIYIPVGKPVLLELKAADVIHSFWVPNLAGKMDLLPERMNRFWIQSDRLGVFRGQCAEFCGTQHALMGFKVVVLPEEEFNTWLAEKSQPQPPPTDALLIRGHDVFFSERAGCNNCHAIKGTEAAGVIGPDLTLMGSRLTVGAATLPNNRGNLAGWLVNPQAIKPGNLMPRAYLEPDELHALTAYLESLK